MFEITPYAKFNATIPSCPLRPSPSGHRLAQALADSATKRGLEVGDIGNWRGVGWIFYLRLEEELFDICVSQVPREVWMLAVTQKRNASIVSRLLDPQPYGSSSALRIVASMMHKNIAALPNVSDIRWCLNGHPAIAPSVPEPDLLFWPEH